MSSKITLQGLFEKAWQAFIVDKQNLAYDQKCCQYRCPSGLRCAVGLSLPDDLLDKLEGEELSFSQLVRHYPDYFDASITALSAFDLDDIQDNLHDEWVHFRTIPRSEMHNSYISVAKRYSLAIPRQEYSDE